jgi:hypothetical protein
LPRLPTDDGYVVTEMGGTAWKGCVTIRACRIRVSRSARPRKWRPSKFWRSRNARGDDEDIATQIGIKVQDAITSASDANVGLLRHLARILTPGRDGRGRQRRRHRAGGGAQDAGISYEP